MIASTRSFALYLDENLGAVAVQLTIDELRDIDEVLPAGTASGSRYNEQGMKACIAEAQSGSHL